MIAIPIILVLVLAVIIGGYLKAPPDTAYVISGPGKRRILIGKAGWRMPFFTRLDKLSLSVMQVDVKTSEAVPTNEFINVTVDGVVYSRLTNIDLYAKTLTAIAKRSLKEDINLFDDDDDLEI